MESASEILPENKPEQSQPNGLETGYSNVAKALEKIVSQWEKQLVPMKLLRALCQLTAREEQKPVNGYTPDDLVDCYVAAAFCEQLHHVPPATLPRKVRISASIGNH